MSASTNEATDNLAKHAVDALETVDDKDIRDVKPLRVYRPLQERTRTEKDEANDESLEEVTDLTADQMLYGTLTELKQDSLSKNFNHVELSLQTRTNQCAEEAEGKQVLMSGWNDKDEDEPYAQLYDESGTRIRDVEDPEKEPKVDIFDQLRHFNKKLLTSKYRDWSAEDKKHAKKANMRVQNYVMSNVRLIITTTNGIGGQYIKTPFGKGNGEPIFIFMEEASQEPEPNTWMFTKLAELRHVVGAYLIGDQEQLKPAAYSSTSTPPINEFRPLITVSLFTRLIDSGFPSFQLRRQYRAHPDLIDWENHVLCDGKVGEVQPTLYRFSSFKPIILLA